MSLDFGKHRGLTFEQCQQQHPDYCEWLLSQPANFKTAAFRDFLEGSAHQHSVPKAAPVARRETSSHVFSFGKYSGKSYDEVCRTDAQYCQWLAKSAGEPNASAGAKQFAAFVRSNF